MSSPVVVVTGASRGIGLAAVRKLIAFDARVVALSRSRTYELEELSSNNGVLSIQCNVADEQSVIQAISTTEQTFGRIDGLVLNAGVLEPLCRIADATPLSDWKKHFDVNFFSLVSTVRAALPALRKAKNGGRIVFISSGAAISGSAGWGPYNASKAAMNSLCRTLAAEEPSITSVALRPGVVDTAMQVDIRELASSKESMPPENRTKFINLHKDGKLLHPDIPGHIIAKLVLEAPASLSGKFVNWQDEDCKPFRA